MLKNIALAALSTNLLMFCSLDACGGPDRIWVGGVSTDWGDENNWDPCPVPASSNPVTIDVSTTYQPTVSGTYAADSVTLDSGATLTISTSNGQFTVNSVLAEVSTGNVVVGTSATMTVNTTLSGSGTLSYQLTSGGSLVGYGPDGGTASVSMTGGFNRFTLAGDGAFTTLNSTASNDIILLAGDLTINGPESSSIAAQITDILGTNELIINADVTLTNTNNSFAGDITINEGILSSTDGNCLGADSGSIILDGGTLRIGASTTSLNRPFVFESDSTIHVDSDGAGVILYGATSGSGNLNVIGSGVLWLGEATTATGNITVSSEGLVGSTATLFGNIDISEGSTVAFFQEDDGIFSGVISGEGQVGVVGTGESILRLTGLNTYAGGTVIEANGILQGNTLTIPGDIEIASGAGLILSQEELGGLTGELSGSGAFIKHGPADLFIATDSSGFTGTTAIIQGAIILSSGSLGGDVEISSGCTLGGTGTIGGDVSVASGGTVSPSSFPVGGPFVGLNHPQRLRHAPISTVGVLNVLGNYIQGDGSTLEVVINGNGESSYVDVSETATIGSNTSVLVNPIDGSIKTNTNYLVLHADGGVFGEFTSISSTLPAFKFTLSYDANNVFALFLKSYESVAVTNNQKAVAKQLDSLSDPTSSQSALLASLDLLSTSQLLNALDQLGGQQYTHTLSVAQVANRQFIQQLYNPLRSLLVVDPCRQRCECGDVDFWIAGGYGRAFQEGNSETKGWKGHDYEIVGGAQASLGCDWTLGTAVSYERDDIDYHVGGVGKTNVVLGALYALYRPETYYVLGDLILGRTIEHTRRAVDAGNEQYYPHGTQKVWHTALYVEGGKDYCFCDNTFLIQPFVALEADWFRRGSVHEHGGSPVALQINSRSYQTAFSYLGVHLLATDCYFQGFDVGVDCSWQYLLSQGRYNRITAAFQQFGQPFIIEGVYPTRNALDASFYIAKSFCDLWRLFAEVSGTIGKKETFYHYTLGITTQW